MLHYCFFFNIQKSFINFLGWLPKNLFQDNPITSHLIQKFVKLLTQHHLLINSLIRHISYVLLRTLCRSSLKHSWTSRPCCMVASIVVLQGLKQNMLQPLPMLPIDDISSNSEAAGNGKSHRNHARAYFQSTASLQLLVHVEFLTQWPCGHHYFSLCCRRPFRVRCWSILVIMLPDNRFITWLICGCPEKVTQAIPVLFCNPDMWPFSLVKVSSFLS